MTIERRLPHIVLSVLTLLLIAGCGGGGSSAALSPPPPPAVDTTVPTVSAVQAPAANVNRTVMLTLTATDNVGVTAVRFLVDGVLLGSVATAPYSIDWDTSGETEGDHTLTAEAEDAAGNIATSAAATVTVQNVVQFAVTLSGQEEVPASNTQALAQAALTINLVSGDVQGNMTTSGITATAAHIHDAFAGTNGSVMIPLVQDALDPTIFTAPAGSLLDSAEVDLLLAGGLYVNVHSAAAPDGEIRGQILPDGFVLRFTDLAGIAAVPRVHSLASGRAAVTLDQVSGALVVHAQIVALDDSTLAHVHQAYAGAAGAVLVPLTKDPLDAGHWSAEGMALNTAGLDAFASGQLYVNVHSPANPGGEIRGQILPDGIKVIFTELSGEQRVPVVDTLAEGLVALTLDEAGALVTIHANTSRIDDANNAHLHGAYAGANGGVEVGLTQDGSDPAHWFTEEAALTTVQLDALLAGATYVNVHSPANGGGEIRGQVIPEGIVFAFGKLSGDQRVPVVNTTATGTFAVTVNPAAGTLVAHANTIGIVDPTLAHIHDGYAGTNGGVAVPLELGDPNDDSHWSAIDAPITADQLAALRSGRYYVNVHTLVNGGGEIRGQIAPPPVEVLFTVLSGAEEVPPVTTTATAIAATTVDRDTGVVTVHLNSSGIVNPTGSHIHTGSGGQNGPVLIPLEQDVAGDPDHWSVTNARFDNTGLANYKGGQLYANLHTQTNVGGEIRGQIVPPDAADFDNQAPAVTLTSPGSPVSGTVALTADASDNQGVVAVRFLVGNVLIGSDASAPYSIDWDTTTVANGQVTLTAEADDDAGNTGVSADVVVTVENAAPVTLSQLQTQIFSLTCAVSGCHSGPTSNILPMGMDLSDGASHASLVNVPSLTPGVTLDRVEPGDPDNSYLIQKLEGGPGITQMPQGGPFLDEATINMVRQWISDGAPNN